MQQFYRIFQESSIAQSLTEFDGTIYQVNRKALEIMGYEFGEVVGRTLGELGGYVETEQRDQLLAMFKRDGRVRDQEVRMRTKSGDIRDLMMNWDTFSFESRELIFATFYDITERKQREQNMRRLHAAAERQAQELALLHEVRTVLARSVDLPTLIRAVVEGIVETFGYTLVSLYLIEGDTLVLQHHYGYDIVLPRIPLTTGVMARSVRTRQPILLEDVNTDPEFLNTVPGITSEVCVPLFVNGDVVGVLNVESVDAVALNAADLRLMIALSEHISLAIQRARLYTSLAESERREREQRLFAEALRDTASGLNATLDLERMLDLVIKQMRHVLPPFQGVRVVFMRGGELRVVSSRGYPTGAFDNATLLERIDCVRATMDSRALCLFTDCWEQPGRLEGTPMSWVRAIIGAPITFNDRAIGMIFLDSGTPNVFTQKHAEQLRAFADQAGIAIQKAQLYKRLRRQTRMRMQQAMEYERRVNESRAQFGIAVSHEFRTPLTTIQTSADLIRLYDSRLPLDRRKDLLNKIGVQVKHLTHLLDDIMLLSKSDLIGMQLNLVPMDLDQFCADIAAEIQWIAGNKHRLFFVGDGRCQNAYLDEDLTRRILINLLTNAVKYSPEGGKVLFSLRRENEDAVIEIADHGIGIPESDIPRLFEAFHRAGNVGAIPGTGLGLPLVKQAVELQKGEIHIVSQEGVGSTFTVRLPMNPT